MFARGKMYPAGSAPGIEAAPVDGVTPPTLVCAPGFAAGVCGRGIAGCAPPGAWVPELCRAILGAAPCAVCDGAFAPAGTLMPGASIGGGIWPPAGGVGPATAPNLAGIFWPAIHESNCACVTVKTLKRMFACDEPQYSAQNPFQTLLAIELSGVYPR